MPIHCQSCLDQIPIRSNLMPIQCKFIANPWSSRECQSDVNSFPFLCKSSPKSHQCQSISIQHKSCPNPMSIKCQSSADPSQLGINVVPIHCQLMKTPMSIHKSNPIHTNPFQIFQYNANTRTFSEPINNPPIHFKS